MNRRKLLHAFAGLGTVYTSGCLTGRRTPGEGQRQINVVVRNDSSGPAIIDVFFTRKGSETTFFNRYDLDAESADESESFVGSPETVYVIVDEQKTRVTDFDATKCDSDQSVIAGVVYNKLDEIRVGFACSGG